MSFTKEEIKFEDNVSENEQIEQIKKILEEKIKEKTTPPEEYEVEVIPDIVDIKERKLNVKISAFIPVWELDIMVKNDNLNRVEKVIDEMLWKKDKNKTEDK